MKNLRRALAAAVVLLWVGAAAAQMSGSVNVRVVDPGGNPLPGATVTIRHPLNYVKTTSYRTDKGGVVAFPVLRPGEGYSVDVSFPTFAAISIPVHVRSGDNDVAVTMFAKVEERVTVTASDDKIDLDQQEASTRFTDEFIQDLPVAGRFYQNVLTLAPGVQDPEGDGNPTVHGSRSRDFKMEVGGISNVDPLTGRWMSRINPNSIEEMEVITSGAGAEYGRAQGGFGRIIQKQGSNDHEGVFEFYYRARNLDGRGASHTSNLPEPDYNWYQPSIQFTGPLLKDKLWYRLSHELFDIGHPVDVTSGVIVQQETAATHDDLLTWQVSPRNKLALQYQTDPYELTNVGVSSLRGPDSAWLYKRNGSTYKLGWTAPYSPRVLVDSTLSWQDLNTGLFPNQSDTLSRCFGGVTLLERLYCVDAQTGAVSGSYPQRLDDHRQRLTLRSDATLYGGRFWGMSHQFEMGVIVENERYFRSLQYAPTADFFQKITEGFGGTTIDNFALVTMRVPGSDEVRATGTNWGLHAQHRLKPRENLTITLGARLEREEINSEGHRPFDPSAEVDRYLELVATGLQPELASQDAFTVYEDLTAFREELKSQVCKRTPGVPPGLDTEYNRCVTMFDGIGGGTIENLVRFRAKQNIHLTNTNVSPKFAVAWSPWSNGKTAFKGTYGRQYNFIPLLIPLQELNPIYTTMLYRVLADVALLEEGVPAPSAQVVAPDLQTPYNDELTLSVERQLWPETTLRVSYINRKYRDQIQDTNLNFATGDYGRCVTQVLPQDRTLEPADDDAYPGIGDGILDDCVGETVIFRQIVDGAELIRRTQRPDGTPDIYKLNPYWGDIYEIGNHNAADYDSFVAELTRRQYRGWEMQASYTWSKLIGDGEDFFQQIGDDPGLSENERGYQSNDQRHVVKMQATTITPWGVRLGTTVSWQSGLPYSVLRRKLSADQLTPALLALTVGELPRTRVIYRTGERNDQRNDSYWDVNVRATKELTLGRRLNLQLSAEVFNVLNDGTYVIYNRDTEIGQQFNGYNEAYRRFGREWQLGMKLAF